MTFKLSKLMQQSFTSIFLKDWQLFCGWFRLYLEKYKFIKTKNMRPVHLKFLELYLVKFLWKFNFFSRLRHNYASAPIAQLAASLTFFIWLWPYQTWPERVSIPPWGTWLFFFVQINFSNHFWYVFVSYIDKLEWKVLGHQKIFITNHFSGYIWVYCIYEN
jgi:hypothetical protein